MNYPTLLGVLPYLSHKQALALLQAQAKDSVSEERVLSRLHLFVWSGTEYLLYVEGIPSTSKSWYLTAEQLEQEIRTPEKRWARDLWGKL